MNTNARLIDILDSFQKVREQLDPGLFVSALIVALLAAFAASLMYRFFYERRGTGSQVHRAFPLLALSVTTLFIGVQISIPLSLGLLGSLSIIRFRTPIKEPEEVGFIMLVIAASICAATFNFSFILIMYVMAFISLIFMRFFSIAHWFKNDGMLVFTLSADEASAKVADIDVFLKAETSHHALESSSVRDGVATFQYVFSGLSHDVAEFQAALASQASFASINVFLNRPNGIR